MMKKGQVFVRAKMNDGSWGNVDILDLNDESFRAFIIQKFIDIGIVCAIKDEFVEGEDIILCIKED